MDNNYSKDVAGVGDGLGTIRAHYIYCALYFYYYYTVIYSKIITHFVRCSLAVTCHSLAGFGHESAADLFWSLQSDLSASDTL